ncbi:hypothetical protein Tco_0644263 [Tanacetum coccineum]
MAGLDEGLKMLKNRAVLEPPTFKPEFLLQAARGTISFVADFFLALIEWPVIGMTKESSVIHVLSAAVQAHGLQFSRRIGACLL